MGLKSGIVGTGVIIAVAAGVFAYTKAVPTSVGVTSPKFGPAVEAVYATGTVEPGVMIALSPKTTARLTALYADEGKNVKKGDLLAQFEDTDLAAVMAQLEAGMNLASHELERKEKLVRKNYISPDAYDQAKAAYDKAKAAYDEATAKREFLKLYAPQDALIIKRDGEIGEVIPATGSPVFYLSADNAPLRISSEVDEEDIVHVETGQKVLIQADAYPDQIFEGHVTSMTPKGDPVSRSYRVRIEMDKNAPLRIGMTAETNIVYREAENSLLIPLGALGDGNKVQKVEDDHIKTVTVDTGIEGKSIIEIKGNLGEGDRIVSPYDPDLKDGARVRVR